MTDKIEIGNRVTTVDVSPVFDVYSRVIIHISDDEQVSVGDESGRTLEFDNPFGSESMAQEILDKLQGFQYRPYDASGALLDPAAEIGDALETTTSYGGIYTRSRNFGRLMKADVAAPHDEEIDHEFKFESPTERKFKREVGEVRASLIITNTLIQSEVARLDAKNGELTSRLTQTSDAITAEVTRAKQAEGTLSASLSVQADEISAKVSASGGNNSSFGWKLNSNSHSWYSGNTEVMKISATGLMVKGEVQATSGKIGGFTIGSRAIYNNISQYGGTQTSGVYLGTDGIQLGQNFKVNSSGSVTASSLTLKGTITFLNADGTSAGTLSAASLRQGAYQAATNYGNWNDTYTSCSPGGYVFGGAAGFYGGTGAGGKQPASWYADSLYAINNMEVFGSGKLRCRGDFILGNTTASWKTQTVVVNEFGDTITLRYMGN